jgi:phospholipid-binding lipoprotein MlaA
MADGFLAPWNYLVISIPINVGIGAYDQVNKSSLAIGEYEDRKEASLDSSIALEDANHQLRQKKVKER